MTLLLLLACTPEPLPDLCPTEGDPTVTMPERPLAHAHNDYEHDRPLAEALELGFPSVEADVWYRRHDIQVSHSIYRSHGTLAELYIDPLRERVEAQGSVHGDGQPFTLWIDVKEKDEKLVDALVPLLDEQDWLSLYDDEGLVEQKAVNVILTGGGGPGVMAANPAPRPYVIESGDPSFDADPTYRAASVSWKTWFEDGFDADNCACIVGHFQALGRPVRFFHAPDTPESWQQQIDCGATWIGADDIGGLADYLAGG